MWLFWLGVIATVAYRIIIILNEYSGLAVKIAWYIGTIGFMWYFAHRWQVQNYRGKIIKERCGFCAPSKNIFEQFSKFILVQHVLH